MLKFTEFENYIKESKDSKHTAHFFDLDQTLVDHDQQKLRVHVKDSSGNRVKTLTNSEFNTHVLPDHHSYDFHEFASSDVFGQTAKPIHKMINRLKAVHKAGEKAEIVTARSDMDDQKKFAHHMKKYGIDIDQTHVRRAGNEKGSTAAAKTKIIKDQIDKYGYQKVHLYDDSHDNLNSFMKLKKSYPNVDFHSHHVDHQPDIGETTITSKKAE